MTPELAKALTELVGTVDAILSWGGILLIIGLIGKFMIEYEKQKESK